MLDTTGLFALNDVPDGIATRCIKELRWDKSGWPPAIVQPEIDSCEHHEQCPSTGRQWEWDEQKSASNQEKHGISFEDASRALDADSKAVRVPVWNPGKWDKLDGFDFEANGVERTDLNTNPIRDIYVFERRGKLWTMIATLRGELGLARIRIISVRRAKSRETELYRDSHLSGNAW